MNGAATLKNYRCHRQDHKIARMIKGALSFLARGLASEMTLVLTLFFFAFFARFAVQIGSLQSRATNTRMREEL